MATNTVAGSKIAMDVAVVAGQLSPTASEGALDDEAYSDATGAADGTVIALLKGIYVQLAIIAENTTPTEP